MKKLIALLLALVMMLSLIPMAAIAAEPPTSAESSNAEGTAPEDSAADVDEDKTPADEKEKEKKKESDDPHPAGQHEYGYASNAKYHWLQCPCGCQISMEPHVDPKDAADDYCFCGYHFSDNADLVTLWVNGCPPIKNFNKNTTEYKLNAYTYKDVKSIKVSTRTFDSEATVELPEDLTLKAGENKFDVKVISENQKVTKTYTLIITK